MDKGTVVRRAIIAALSTVLLPQAAFADYFRSYDADSQPTAPDPTSADGGSWNINAGGAGAPSITRTAGTTGTRNFWNVADSVTNGSVIYNETTASDANILAALRSSDGWKFTITLRVNSSIDPTFTGPGDTTYGAATFIDIRTGVAPQDAQGHLYTIAFVNDANRGINGIYNASNGGTAFDPADSAKLISNVDVGQFHTLSMVMVPDNSNHANDAVFIYLDGQTSSIFTLAGTNIGQSTVARVQVGAAAQGQTQNVDYENFTFQSPAPEPASLGILCFVGAAALCRRPRKHA